MPVEFENRRRFLTSAAIGTAGLVHTGARAQELTGTSAAEPLVDLVTTPPVVMAPRADGVEIVWGVSRHARGWVELQPVGAGVQVVTGDPFGYAIQSDQVLRVRMVGLLPGTTYLYRTVTESMGQPPQRIESDWRAFRTLSPQAAATRFAVWNDTHAHDDTIAQLHQRTPTDVDFLLWNGDICNDWHQAGALAPTLLHPAGIDFTAQRPLAFVWGNHDLRGEFGYQLPRYVATPQGKSYYAFRSGPVAVVCLNTGEDKADDHPSFRGRVACEPLRREQAQWLRDVVLTDPVFRNAPYRVVFCHLPLRWMDENDAGREYDSFSRRSRDHWHAPLVEWSAQVVISGHMHQAHWMAGTPEFPYAQLVGGGPQPQAATVITGSADQDRLTVTMSDLSGRVLHAPQFPPIA